VGSGERLPNVSSMNLKRVLISVGFLVLAAIYMIAGAKLALVTFVRRERYVPFSFLWGAVS
jgi:hypothetical protein